MSLHRHACGWKSKMPWLGRSEQMASGSRLRMLRPGYVSGLPDDSQPVGRNKPTGRKLAAILLNGLLAEPEILQVAPSGQQIAARELPPCDSRSRTNYASLSLHLLSRLTIGWTAAARASCCAPGSRPFSAASQPPTIPSVPIALARTREPKSHAERAHIIGTRPQYI